MDVIALSVTDIAVAAALVLALGGVAWLERLAVSRALLLAALRMVIQLALVGLVLEAVFALAHWYWVVLIGVGMLLIAAREVHARQRRPLAGGWGYGIGAGAMFVASFATAALALLVLVRPEPWYRAQYAIPLLGMLLGNTMNGVALGLERLTEGAWRQRAAIEARLMLGEPWQAAIAPLRRESVRSGMIPVINAMAAAGVVSLPGMMTGQILAGSPPGEAVRYQILIFLLITVGTGTGTLLANRLVARRLFDERGRLRLERLSGAG
ncbi:ABC transporter permease [Arhodomonas aquaeolei]|uniref:ABC transporter permease n=1 Tax=Arhodomonas aquaeolei TaxID=2369 RepID=UPI002169B91D|nr:ABC transporter permease [Arhodomonas aquaeolei]MCS4505256.1 ABC transporter permease [Arhodomonas aquaeolei]